MAGALCAREDDLARVEFERVCFVAGQLDDERLTLVVDQLDTHVEAQVNDPPDLRLAGRLVGFEGKLEVMGADEVPVEPDETLRLSYAVVIADGSPQPEKLVSQVSW